MRKIGGRLRKLVSDDFSSTRTTTTNGLTEWLDDMDASGEFKWEA